MRWCSIPLAIRFVNKDVIQSQAKYVAARFNCSWVFFFLIPTGQSLLDFAFDNSGGISYSVTHYKMNWEEAQKKHNNNVSELADILHPYSQALLFLLAEEYGEPLWIGFNSNMVRRRVT